MKRGLFFAVLPIMASAGAEPIENFQLLDQHGSTHVLQWHADTKAVVILIQGNGCPIVRNAWPTYRQIREDYQHEDIVFLMLNSNIQDDRSAIWRESDTFKMDISILKDEDQSVGESLGVIRTAEAFVIDPKTWEVVYRGAIDDRLTYEYQRAEASEHYLRDALDAVLAGEPIAVPQREALGCLVNFPNRRRAQL